MMASEVMRSEEKEKNDAYWHTIHHAIEREREGERCEWMQHGWVFISYFLIKFPKFSGHIQFLFHVLRE